MTRMPDAVEIEVVAGSGVEGARRATGGPDPATTLPARAPDPEVEATVALRGVDPTQIGAVGQRGLPRQAQILLDAPQQIRPRRAGVVPQRVTEKVSVPQAQHARRQGREHVVGQAWGCPTDC